jgi:hypothetical protein
MDKGIQIIFAECAADTLFRNHEVNFEHQEFKWEGADQV